MVRLVLPQGCGKSSLYQNPIPYWGQKVPGPVRMGVERTCELLYHFGKDQKWIREVAPAGIGKSGGTVGVWGCVSARGLSRGSVGGGMGLEEVTAKGPITTAIQGYEGA